MFQVEGMQHTIPLFTETGLTQFPHRLGRGWAIRLGQECRMCGEDEIGITHRDNRRHDVEQPVAVRLPPAIQ